MLLNKASFWSNDAQRIGLSPKHFRHKERKAKTFFRYVDSDALFQLRPRHLKMSYLLTGLDSEVWLIRSQISPFPTTRNRRQTHGSSLTMPGWARAVLLVAVQYRDADSLRSELPTVEVVAVVLPLALLVAAFARVAESL